MTVAFFSGRARRAGAALGAAAAGLLVLSACDKPTPLATVTVGSESVNSEAACYNDGKALKESVIQDCLTKKEGKAVKVSTDDKIRFGVDPEIADRGWTIFIGGQQAEQEPYKKTYRTLPANAFFSTQSGEATTEQNISIVESSGNKLTGVWHFKLKKSS
ncbi:DUF2771 domain-containing protein [Streptomyces sp. LP05-1]|uniref:DUF2771 domain-containing protein n=1 Tax=Streptomyces pyxinae TaxID=2970734 RepID=A0ABT2CEX6_9ACTN|nr:DUF2771 domain-containing protein [Streptomyces sp. LP05-1]MCS0635962.1 DUF2771 domain-containing protein [Streptomyces sp. LP05-1]